MITLKISGNNFELSKKVVDYVNDKIGELDKYLPRGARQATGRVILSMDPSGREDNQFVCETHIEVPGSLLQSKEATINIYAAIDIVEAKLRAQIVKYKDKHSPKANRRKVWLNKLLGDASSTEEA
ncbi:MAG TPA: ribosome-associated translation inhibitor RaiA [Candidatus Saccharimonadia bacterium]|nr:ribosome-associated translation inhibitor RaiA [Candidatus Saccharimonadia bacterium]